MKLIASFLFVIGSLLAFGQSPKKLNKQLMARFVLEQQKQDSAFTKFTQAKKELDSVRKVAQQKIDQLSERDRVVGILAWDVSEYLGQLKQLGENPTTLSPTLSKEELPKYKELIRPIKQPLKEQVKFDKVSDRLYLELLKVKEQNIALTEKIKEYENYSRSNSIQEQNVESNRDKLVSFIPKLDSLLGVYHTCANDLKAKKAQSLDKLDELRGNYIEKGPSGFPEAYGRIFYDAFPPKQRETIEEGMISDHIEGAEEYYEPVPPPVEEKRHEKEDVFTIVEEPASFPGGIEAMKIFISKNLRYPEKMKEAAVQGKVYLKFIVSESGELSDVKVLRGLPDCPECDMEAIRVVKAMPKWVPGKNNGKAVKSYYNLPVSFKLQ